MKNQLKKTIAFTLIVALFALQVNLAWAIDNVKAPSKEALLKSVNKAHQEIDAMKERLLKDSNSEMDTFLAHKMTTDFHNKVNSYYADAEVSNEQPVSQAQSQNGAVAQLFNNPVAGTKGGSASGSSAAGSQNTTPVAGLGGSASGSGATAAPGNGLTNILGGLGGSNNGNAATTSNNNNAGTSSGSGATSSSSSNGSGGFLSGLFGNIGNLLGGGSSSSNSSSGSGIGGFISNTLGSLFGGNGSGNGNGVFSNLMSGLAGSLSNSSGFLGSIGNILQNGVTGNGGFSFKAMLFNTIWNLISKWLIKTVTKFVNNLASKITTKVNGFINNININLPLVGNWITSLKQKATTAVTNLVNKLKVKALQFIQSMLAKAKSAIKKKLGIQ